MDTCREAGLNHLVLQLLPDRMLQFDKLGIEAQFSQIPRAWKIDAVVADGELEESEAAAGIGGGAENESGEFVDGGDGGGGDDGAGLVLHGARDLAGGLGEGGGGDEEEDGEAIHER